MMLIKRTLRGVVPRRILRKLRFTTYFMTSPRQYSSKKMNSMTSQATLSSPGVSRVSSTLKKH
jgi:hypothetical protein